MDKIEKLFLESLQVKAKTLQSNHQNIAKAAKVIIQSLQKGGKVMFFGNGGSAADSQHLAAELIGRFQKERKALAAIALTTDTSAITALANDYSYDVIFARQIEGLGKKGDVVIGLSTSGNSKNVIAGIRASKKRGIKTIVLTGNTGGRLKSLCDISLIVPSQNTARIQESHICMGHIICEIVEDHFKRRK